MPYPITQSARQNHLLAALPMLDYARFANALEEVDLKSGQVIHEAGGHSDFVYFPTTCTASLVSSTLDGDMSELAITGHEGVVGLPLILGMPFMNHRVMVLCSGQAYRLPASIFESALAQSEVLRRLSLRYVQAVMAQMAQSIVCSRHHSVMQRLSCWLLFNRDRSASDQLRVTHEMIAHMLGVRRESITQAAGALQTAGLIRTSRGRITIEDGDGLGSKVCECYGAVQSEYRRLLDPSAVSQGLEALLSCVQDTPQSFRTVQYTDHDAAAPALNGATDHRKYADIYDFAPVGLLSVDVQGRLLDINLAGAIMLGVQRSHCTEHEFAQFLMPASRPVFAQFHAEVLSGKCRRHCELTLAARGQQGETQVRLDATVDEDGQENRMVMQDISAQTRQAAQWAAHEREQHALQARFQGQFWSQDPHEHLGVSPQALAQQMGAASAQTRADPGLFNR